MYYKTDPSFVISTRNYKDVILNTCKYDSPDWFLKFPKPLFTRVQKKTKTVLCLNFGRVKSLEEKTEVLTTIF